MFQASRLSRMNRQYGSYVRDVGSGYYVYHVRTPQMLVQAAGYLKHVLGQEESARVYFRGQESLYGCTMTPTLYRGCTRLGAQNGRDQLLRNYLSVVDAAPCMRPVPQYAREALLQHYGIKTRWLDVIDNIWIALWFACHSCAASGASSEFLHFSKRNPRHQRANRFVYILLLRTDSTPSVNHEGMWEGPNSQCIDLRIASPSTFVRPHSQHGLLVRLNRNWGQLSVDHSSLVAGVIRVDLADALEWLGDGHLLSTNVIFPPPMYDAGYADLLAYLPQPPNGLGAVQYIFA